MKKVTPLLRVKRIFEASTAWAMYFMLKLLPVDVASNIMGKTLRGIGGLIPVSHTARINLDIAFPNKTAAEKKEILLGCWENIGRVVGEFPHLKTIAQQNERVTIIGGKYADEMKNNGRSAILFSGHFANWEVLAAVASRRGIPLSVVYRPANNPLTESIYQYARKGIALAQYPKNREGAKQILKALRGGNEVIAMLVDQKMNDGLEVPLFGKPAMTAKAIAEFALRQNVPIYPIRISRGNGAHFTVEMFPAMTMPAHESHTENTLELLTTINHMLEQWITQKPEDWFWLHRRWPKETYR